MSLRIENDMSVFNGKRLIGKRFNAGNEYIVHLEDEKDGSTSRVRISAALKNLLDDYKKLK